MNVEVDAILALPAAEKLKLIELLWDSLEQTPEEVPLPQWIIDEGLRRRAELRADLLIARTHEETWQEIRQYRTYVRKKIAEGLADVEAGRLISTEEVRKRLGR
jgi:putative addiction module component (TIGR02574 family)